MRKHFATLASGALLALAAIPSVAAAAVPDGIPDAWEVRHGLSLSVNQARLDTDRDGLNNLNEYRSHTNPRLTDTDRDRIRDGSEDYDRDGATNLEEQYVGTLTGDNDTDNDGVLDGDEDGTAGVLPDDDDPVGAPNGDPAGVDDDSVDDSADSVDDSADSVDDSADDSADDSVDD